MAEGANTVVVETYPGEFYRQLGMQVIGKRKQEVRRSCAGALLKMAQQLDILLDKELEQQIADGFGPSKSGDDRSTQWSCSSAS